MKLAELVIQLSANTASLKRDFEQAASMAKGFADSIKGALEGLGVGLGAAGLVEAIKSVTEYEEQIGLAAKSTGMTTEQMSGLAYAAKQFAVPLHDVTMGLAYFDRVEGGLMRSKQGQTAIHDLGLSVRDLTGYLKHSHAMLMEVAKKFSHLKDTAEKTAVATAFFGQTYGLELIPFLDQGVKGIAALEEKARQLGVTFSEDDVQAAVKLESAARNLNAALLGVEVGVSRHALPALTVLAESLSGDSDAVREYVDGLKVLGLEFEKLSLEVDPLHFLSGGMKRQIAALTREQNNLATSQLLAFQKMQSRLPDLTDLGKMPSLMINPIGGKNHIDRAADSLRSLREELTGMSSGSIARGLAKFKDLGASSAELGQAKSLLTAIQSLKDKRKAQEEYNSALGRESSIQKSLAEAVSGITGARKDYLDSISQLNGLAAKGVPIVQALALAQDKYREELLGTAKTPSQLNIALPSMDNLAGLFTPGSTKYLGSRFDQLDGKAQQFGKAMQHSFVGMIVEGQNFGSVLKNLTTLFAEFLLKALVFKQLSTAFGTTGFGGLIGSFFGGLAGGKAAGGPVTAGSLYMVGESGPELFAPGASGTIIPNGGSSSGGRGGSSVNIDARGADAGVEHRIMRALQASQKQTLGQSLVMNYEYQARGGTL